MFVADMDFRAPEPLIEALRKRVEHGIFGYQFNDPDVYEIICERMKRLYAWKVQPTEIIYLPGLVPGLSFVCRAIGEAGDDALIMPPVYPPFLSIPANQGLSLRTAELKMVAVNQSTIRYEIDFDAFQKAIAPSTKLAIFCQPHNPVGRAFTREELKKIATMCVENDLVICSDEIHCDLVLGSTKHIPTATLSEEIADRCITLMAPNKSFNIAGLNTGFAIVQNKELKKKLEKALAGLAPVTNCLGVTALQSAYTDCAQWLEELKQYLLRNRDTLTNYIEKNMPGIKTTIPEATYLAWIDCRDLGINGNAHKFFLKEARVALNDGRTFGSGGEGFVRFNFACPKSQMLEALERMKTALQKSAV